MIRTRIYRMVSSQATTCATRLLDLSNIFIIYKVMKKYGIPK